MTTKAQEFIEKVLLPHILSEQSLFAQREMESGVDYTAENATLYDLINFINEHEREWRE